jgi:hypothetical protein
MVINLQLSFAVAGWAIDIFGFGFHFDHAVQREAACCRLGLSNKGTFREHSGDIQGTFREHSGNIQGTFRAHSGNIRGTFREHSGNNQGPSI